MAGDPIPQQRTLYANGDDQSVAIELLTYGSPERYC